MKSHKLCLALALGLWGCPGVPVKPLPLYYTAANADHPKYPRSRYLTGVGLSTLSAQDADAHAANNIATQISAQLQSETSSFQEFSSARGDTAERVTSKISVKADFKHLELVHPVEREQQGETFYSFSVLDRQQTDQVLAQAAEGNLVSFQAAVARALKSRKNGQGGEFSMAAASARKLRVDLDGMFVTRRVVLGRPADTEPDYLVSRNELLAAIEAAKARQVIGVRLKGASSAQLSDYTVNAVKDMGLRPDRAACEERKADEMPDATELSIEPIENCMEGSLGERCEVGVHLSARGCGGGTAGEGIVSQVRGMHPSDREKARRSAWDKITQQVIEAAVRDALKSSVAIGGE